MRDGPAEALVQRLWAARGTGHWTTVSGQEIEVEHPGRSPGGAGPDFQGALLSSVAGPSDVEVHVSPRGWRGHRHHEDPRYGRVSLQVVAWPEASPPCYTRAGREVPTVALGPGMGKGALGRLRAAEPCRGGGRRRAWASLASTLEAAGVERLRERAGVLGDVIQQRGADQALYEAVMEALGYSQNRAPFLKLARALAFHRLRELAASLCPGVTPDEACSRVYGWLLAASGLGPASDPAPPQAVAPGEWTTVGMRPANHPRHRLLAAATLLVRYLGPGLLDGLRPYLAAGAGPLEAALAVTGNPGQPAPLGRDRAREMAVNGVLPALYAWGLEQGQPQLVARVLGVYVAYPSHGEDRVTRWQTSALWGAPYRLPLACYQQGCHHIYQHYCLSRRCGQCPLAC